MSKKPTKSAIKCRATRRHLLNGSETGDLQAIRVTVAYPQKRTMCDLAKSINNACSMGVPDVMAVWLALEDEIKRVLSDGNRVELGSLGVLSLEVGTEQRRSVDEGVTSKDIMVKNINFIPSKKLMEEMDELTFECNGIVAHPLSERRAEEALSEYFSEHQYINSRTFATLCQCSLSTAYRRIEKMVAEGKLKQSGISSKLYEKGIWEFRVEGLGFRG